SRNGSSQSDVEVCSSCEFEFDRRRSALGLANSTWMQRTSGRVDPRFVGVHLVLIQVEEQGGVYRDLALKTKFELQVLLITASSRLIPSCIRGSGPSCPNPCRMAVESLMNPLSVSCVCGHSDTINSQSRDDGSSTN